MFDINQECGLGDPLAKVKVYIGNRPNFEELNQLSTIKNLNQGDIAAIGQACGNGWRKVFNVYAKWIFALNTPSLVNVSSLSSWQDYRDKRLLQANSGTSLLFSKPSLTHSDHLHIVMGKTYANSLLLKHELEWVNHEFAIHKQAKLIVCPYFDYRQLSNIKIIQLVELIKSLYNP